LRFNPSRWLGWIDFTEAALIGGWVALGIFVTNGHRFPDELPIAIGCGLWAIGRLKDRYEKRILGLQRAIIQLQRIEIERR
jgi:hypothetical protein